MGKAMRRAEMEEMMKPTHQAPTHLGSDRSIGILKEAVGRKLHI